MSSEGETESEMSQQPTKMNAKVGTLPIYLVRSRFCATVLRLSSVCTERRNMYCG